jgi:hypothetical protein
VEQRSFANASLNDSETVAPNGAGKISAFNETNQTEKSGLGSMMHTHDYWGKDTRKVILQMDAGLVPLPLMPCKQPGCDFTQSGQTYPPGTAIADFDIPAPPAGGMVYEGTDHLEVLFKNVRVVGTGDVAGEPAVPHPYIHIGFDYLTAADEPNHFHAGPVITPGTPAIIPVKPLDADMPHQLKSLWVFRIYTQEPNAFEFNVTITAVKGNPVVAWPPHPNLYADRTERTILDVDQKIQSEGTAEQLIDGSDAGWQFPDRVISWGTDSLDVTVSNLAYSSPAAISPPTFVLEYHNATYISKLGNGDQAGGRLKDASSDGKTFHFQIPVDVNGYDTPYGQKSRWAFHLIPSYSGGGDQFFPFTESYHLTILAHGHSIDGMAEPGASATG